MRCDDGAVRFWGELIEQARGGMARDDPFWRKPGRPRLPF